jgi:hypothetical protein
MNFVGKIWEGVLYCSGRNKRMRNTIKHWRDNREIIEEEEERRALVKRWIQ